MKQTPYQPSASGQHGYSQLFCESPAPLYIFALDDLQFLDVNQAALEQYGYSRENFLKLDATQIRPETEIERLRKAVCNPPFSYYDYGIWLHRHRLGQQFHVQVYGHRTLFNDREAILVMANNIEQRLAAENLLQSKTTELENILESITDGFYAIDEQAKVTYFNREAERILRCRREDVLGRNLFEFFPESTSSRVYQLFKLPAEQRTSASFQEYYAPLDISVSVHIYPKKDGLSVYFIDTTAQREQLEKIRVQQQQLSNISMSHSHDIRGPLSGILGLLPLIELKEGSSENNLHTLALVKQAARELDQVIRKIILQAEPYPPQGQD